MRGVFIFPDRSGLTHLMGSVFELQLVHRGIGPKALKRGKAHMYAKIPKKIKLIAVDGTKSREELKRLLLEALKMLASPSG